MYVSPTVHAADLSTRDFRRVVKTFREYGLPVRGFAKSTSSFDAPSAFLMAICRCIACTAQIFADLFRFRRRIRPTGCHDFLVFVLGGRRNAAFGVPVAGRNFTFLILTMRW